MLRFETIAMLRQHAFFRHHELGDVARLGDFDRKRGHFVPKEHSPRAAEFVARLLENTIQLESKEIYDNAKALFGLRRRQMLRSLGPDGASVECSVFRMTWLAEQDPDSVRRYRLTRKVMLLASPDAFPPSFDAVLPMKPDQFVIPLSQPPSFDSVVDLLETLGEEHELAVHEDQDTGIAGLRLPDASSLEVRTRSAELVFTSSHATGCLSLLERAQAALSRLGPAASPFVAAGSLPA